MSKISELVNRYSHYDFRDLTNRQMVELRQELKSFHSADLQTLEDHRKYLELLQQFRLSVAETDKLKGDNYPALLESLLSVGEDGLYSNNLRFIYELIQNVDDCEYVDPSNASLDVHFDTRNGRIILSYNEIGFSPFNVFAITGIAEAAKNVNAEKVEIGEKGIGFKSVFGVAEKVLIQSGWFSFELNKKNFTIPLPVYDEYDGISGTQLILYVNNKSVYDIYREFSEEYCKKDTLVNRNPLLFLNKLTSLHIYVDSFRSLSFKVSRDILNVDNGLNVEENVIISTDLVDPQKQFGDPIHQKVVCTRYTYPVLYNHEMCVSRYGTSTAFSEKKMIMQIIVPSVPALYAEDAIVRGTLYSFLPTQIKLSVPLLCHVPFKLDGSREFVDPQNHNAWFKHSCSCLSDMLEHVYIDLAHRIKEDIINYLPKKNQYFFESENGKSACLKQECFRGETFLQLPIFRSVDDHYLKANQVFMYASEEEIIEPDITYRLLGVDRELFLPSEQSKSRNPGIGVMRDVHKRLFRRGMVIPRDTGAIFEILSKVKSFSLREELKGLEKCEVTISQVVDIGQYPQYLRVFNEHLCNLLKEKRSVPLSLTADESQIGDLRYLDINGNRETLDENDFDINAQYYLKKIKFRCVYTELLPERAYFISNNALILSSINSMEALSAFCRHVDEDGHFAAALSFRVCTNRLNQASDDMPAKNFLHLLRSVRKSFSDAFGKTVYENYIKLINDSGMNPDRFLNELLQNADDCAYSDDVTPEFELKISEDRTRLKTTYNENGFTNGNVRALTAIGESTKKKLLSNGNNDKEMIGEKGIGFKSVFSVASKVRIHSGDFYFMLTDQKPTIPELPKNQHDPISGTEMLFELKQNLSAKLFREENILKLCLCLRKLKLITIGKNRVEISDSGSVRTIKLNNKTYDYDIVSYEFNIEDNDLLTERTNNQRVISNAQKIVFYIPRKSSGDYSLYSGLPTSITTRIPVVIDAPFELNTSCEGIIHNRWNEHIKRELYQALLFLVESLKYSQGIDVLRFIRVASENASYRPDVFSDVFLNQTDYLEKVKKLSFLPTYEKFVFVMPFDNKCRRIPNIVKYLIEKDHHIKYDSSLLIKCPENSKYEVVLSAMGIKMMSPAEVVYELQKTYSQYMEDGEFTRLLYEYLTKHYDEFESVQTLLRSMRIVPVKGRTENITEYVSWKECGDRIFTKKDGRISPSNCYFLNTDMIGKGIWEHIFDVENINEFTKQLERANYREELAKSLENLSETDLFEYLLKEYHQNRNLLDNCKDLLKSKIDTVPLINELGEIKRGKIFISYEPMGYFTGNILPQHIVHETYKEFARFLGCGYISDVYFEDLRINQTLCADDIESLQDNHIIHGFEILEMCKRKHLIPEVLLKEYNLSGLSPTSIDCDESVFNYPIKNKTLFFNHINTLLKNKIRIESREVVRKVPYGVYPDGGAFQIDNEEKRLMAMNRYKAEEGYYACQMCKRAKKEQFIEVNNVEKNPKYYWKECGIMLCLECSKHYQELRENKKVMERFHKAIMDANTSSNRPIEITIGTDTLTFSQTHIAEIQEILLNQED